MNKQERAEAQDIFLKAFTLNGNIMLSCRQANVDRSTFHSWCEHDEPFSILYHQAAQNFADLALAEFRKRAMEGYLKPVISMGRMVYEEVPVLDDEGNQVLDKGKPVVRYGKPLMERVVSDTLLAMLIKRHFPEFREKQSIDVNSTSTVRSGAITIDTKEMTDSELAALKAIAISMKLREEHEQTG